MGAGVTGLDAGDNVIGFLPIVDDGASAAAVVAPADVLASAPTTVPVADAAALPMVGLTAWQALFDGAGLTAGQRVLINGAGGAVGGYAVQLAKRAGAHVIASATARSIHRAEAAGADEVLDHTPTVAEPVDVLLNLARISSEELAAFASLVKPGGTLVNTVPTLETPADLGRDVRGVAFFVRSDAAQLAQLVDLVDRGELRIDVAERVTLGELPTIHARSDAGELSGKVIVLASV